MSNPWVLGVITALPLLIGAGVALVWSVPKVVLATILAFGAGTMIASVGVSLFEPAFTELGATKAAAMLLLGTTTFVLLNRLLDHRAGGARSAVGWALLLGVLLDGVPENTALGVTTTADVALLVAIAVGNLPEAIGGAAQMRESASMSRREIVALWGTTAVVLALTVPIARLLGDDLGSGGIATIQAFAGGAVIAVLSTSMLPEAYDDGGPNVAFATALGFAVAFALGG